MRHPVPPPVFFVTAFALAVLLQRGWPLPVLDGAWRRPVAWTLALAGLGLGLWAVGWFARRKTSPVPFHPARTLVIEGPYRFSRNPMYLALSLVHAAAAVGLRQPWALVLLPSVWAALEAAVITLEERHLAERFGAAYEDYCRRVRRWI